MAVYKRYKKRRIKPSDPDWDKGTWYVEFSLRGHYVKEAIPEARTRKQAEQVETQIRQSIFDRKYNKAVTPPPELRDGSCQNAFPVTWMIRKLLTG